MPTRLRLPLLAVALLSTSTAAHALPAFARRFNLACGACHSAVPRLNAFGEAFHENGFKPPGTMWTPLPGTLSDAIEQGMAVWARGEFFEHSDFARGPSPRGGLAVPEHASIYLAGPLTTSTSLFVELENTVHETDINKRGDHTLLPTEPTLYHSEAAPGIDVHGRLFASKVLYQFGLTTDAAPEFLDRIHTAAPYVMLRYDFGDQDGLNGSVSVLGNYGRNAYRVFYLAPAPLPVIPLAVPEETLREPTLREPPSPLHRPPPPPGRGSITAQQDLDVWREGIGANLRRGPWDAYGAYTYDQVYDVPERLAGRFVRRAQGLTAELDYRLTHSLLPSVRYDWMKAGGFQSDVVFEPGPRESQVLHLQMRWYLFEGDNLAKVPIPALLVLSLRDSVNLTPGGSHPFGAWRNALLLGFDFAF